MEDKLRELLLKWDTQRIKALDSQKYATTDAEYFREEGREFTLEDCISDLTTLIEKVRGD